MSIARPRGGVSWLLPLVLSCLATGSAFPAEPKEKKTRLDDKEFFRPELALTGSHVPLEAAMPQLRNQGSWRRYLQSEESRGRTVQAHLDARSGAASSILGAVPLLPGKGVGNRVTLADLSRSEGRAVTGVDATVVGGAVRRFAEAHKDVLGVDSSQFGEARVTRVREDLWQVSIPQLQRGIPVRDARLVASINSGNLVLIGAENWSNVAIDPNPGIRADEALDLGFRHAEGRASEDVVLREPRLEILPTASALTNGLGAPGSGYGHLLAWTFVFQRPPDDARWEVVVDATTGEVAAFQDINLYAERQVKGGVYPVTSTEICPNAGTCGEMQSGWPMPFADTGFAAPNNFTNSGGIYNYTSGTATTTLTGKYVDIADVCGATSQSSSTGNIDLGGTNGQHDCTAVGSAGNTPAARSAFYEVNKMAEMGRGYLPGNTWLQARLLTNVNIDNTCNAFWNGTSINFYRSGGGCRNTGEIAAIFDHEWGHGLDDNDAAGALSNSSEAYADIASIYRLQASCVGYGFFHTTDKGCGKTADGTGFNQNEAQAGAAHCDLDCSGVRDADYLKHSPNTPDTAVGFVCAKCGTGTGPCGRQVHCAAAPVRQAAWDLVTRDLTALPFNYDSQTAFIVGNKLFYQGSGNIGSWHACDCAAGTSNGCGAANGYQQWLTADDDNGSLTDGTPHASAIWNAFNRHGIACGASAPVNSGCAAGPSAAPAGLTVTPGSSQNALSWTASAGATRHWVFRTEGHAGCDFGKTLIAEVTGATTSYTDTAVANGRAYHYNVVAAGSSSACYSPASACVSGTPVAAPDFTLACSPSSLTVAQGSSGNSTCTVSSTNGFNSAVDLSCANLPAGVTCAYNPASVTPPADGSANSTLTVAVASSVGAGTYTFQAQGTSGSLTRTFNMTLQVTLPGPVTVFFDNFETDQGWTRSGTTNTATTGLWERGDPEATASSGAKQLGTTVSGVNDLVTGRLAGAGVGSHDIDGGVTSIQSPPIALPSTGSLTLTFSYYFSHLNNSSTEDYFRVKVVGTTTSTVLEELGANVNDDAAWVSKSVSITGFAGQTVRILIEASDLGGASLVEAAVDDVKITQQ